MTQKPPARQGALWDPNEEFKVFRAYAEGVPLDTIARRQQRTRVAIEQRLKKLGLMDAKGNRVTLMPDIDQSISKIKNRTGKAEDRRDDNDPTRMRPEAEQPVDPDYNLDVFYQIHGMSKRLFHCLKQAGIRDFRETLHRSPAELQSRHGFSSRLLQELLRFQQIYLYNPHPAALEKLAAIQEFKRATCTLARRARTLGQGEDETGGRLCFYLGKLNAELARLEQDQPQTETNGIKAPEGAWSKLTAEKMLGLVYILAAGCAPDNQHVEVISARLGLGDEHLSLQETADILHLTRDRVRWLQERVLNTLVYQLSLRTRSHARLLKELAGRLLAMEDGEGEAVLFKFCNQFMKDGTDWMIAALLYIVMGYYQTFPEAARKARHLKKAARDRADENFRMPASDRLTAKIEALLAKGPKPHVEPSHNLFPHLEGSRKKPGDDSLACEGSFLSRKCSLEITYTSQEEYRMLQFLENHPGIVWFQDRVVAVPFVDEGFERRYYPTLALVTGEGRGLVMDVLQPMEMVRRLTLVKALAAQLFLAEQGIGFALCTREGKGPKDLAAHGVSKKKKTALLSLVDDKGTVSWCDYQRLAEEQDLSEEDLISLVLNEDLALQKNPFRLSRLPEELSFRSLIDVEPTQQNLAANA
ncbi:MAG: hypothetical protein QNK37_26820 [Acidobacteriota bacterium]|nr:hypothetical protein [Acidobacteriota bacterium]